jgi:hypothetical protein
MRTNLLRVELPGNHTAYDVELLCRSPIEPHHHREVADFLLRAIPHALYALPSLYAPEPLDASLLALDFFLSNGAPLQIQLARSGEGERADLLGLVAVRLMRLTELLYCDHLQSCFNAFEERRKGEAREIPGFSVRAWSAGVLAVVPVLLVSEGRDELGEDAEVLLDYHSGNFFLK